MNTRFWMLIVVLSVLVFSNACGGAGGGGSLTGSVAGVVTVGAGIRGPVCLGIRDTGLETEACARGTYSISGVPVGDQMLELTIADTVLAFPVQVTSGEVATLDLIAGGIMEEPVEPVGELTASIDTSGTRGVAPYEVQLLGRGAGGRPPYTYFWDFNGVATSTVQAPRAKCVEPGERTIRLRVTDSEGSVATSSVQIMVDPPLGLTLTPSTTKGLMVGDSVTFTANLEGYTVSGDTPDLSELHYYYLFGDGIMEDGVGLTQVTHTYETPVSGDCAVLVHGGEWPGFRIGAVTKIRVAGEPAPEPQTPSCVATANVWSVNLVTHGRFQLNDDDVLRGTAGETRFAPYADISDPTGLDWHDQVEFVVDWGDGTQTEAGAKHTYREGGYYEAGLWVYIGEYMVHSHSVAVEIDEPFRITHVDWPCEDESRHGSAAKPSGPQKNTPQGTVCPNKSYPANVDTENGKEPVAYFWNFGDGTESRKKNPRHQYTAPGVYVVQIVTIDAEGWLRRKSWLVTVREKLQLLGLAWATSSRKDATNTALKAKVRGGCPEVKVTYRFAGEPRVEQPAAGEGLRCEVIPGLDYTVQVQATDGHGDETPWKTYTVTAPTGR